MSFMHLPTLFSRATGGQVQQWQVFVDGDSFYTIAGQVGGALTQSAPTICEGKNIGKANETSPEKQAEIEARAKFDKKLRSNYFENVSDIDSGFLEPQLAKPCKDFIDDVKWEDGIIVDDKLNGFACLITKTGAFTRANKQYHSIPHVLEEFQSLIGSNPGIYIQGELFNPIYVTELNKISELISVIREPKDITPELLIESRRIVQFHWYDFYGANGITKETPQIERRQALDDIIKSNGFSYIKPVRYDICYSFKSAKEKADEYIARGGEGKIFKVKDAPYQHKRTKNWLKWKKSESAEFTVVDDENPFVEGKGNSQGCAEAVWCELPNGVRAKRFKVNIKGPKDRLREFYKNPNKFRAKQITVDFQEYSPYGVPLIPYTDMVIRKEIEG